ncbi:MAG TPA: SOS response-associated peptidase [Candidatus Fraserbacteria bacterium]|nr:SOS response-associated peptidase [Candidatus Fraserbacteria bacterium]
MCGRFALFSSLDAILDRFELRQELPESGYTPRYNIMPTQPVLTVIALQGGERDLTSLRWGLIPSWAKDPAIGNRLINARAETLFEKPSFRAAVRERRCLILADGFYEWRRTERGKVPMYIQLKSKRHFGFAGLWESWRSPEGREIKSCSIVTTESNELVRPIHNRMPVIVHQEIEGLWLDPQVRSERELREVLRPYPAKEMEAYAVSPLVNSPAHDRPECIEPLRG